MNNSKIDIGEEIYKWASDLFPICRSITGNGVRETLDYISRIIPGLTIHEVPSGTKAFDWIVPDEWNIKEAFIEDSSGEKILDFKDNNLHVLNYSVPIDAVIPLSELDNHLYSFPDRPGAIPYITAYYERKWGFCISENQRKKLKDGTYKVYIDSTLEPGSLTYGELVLPGRDKTEVLLSTYVCHPSLANNEISGPVVTAALSRWLDSLSERKHTYRIVFVPETIGSIIYLSRHLNYLRESVVAGFNVTCVGDDMSYTYLASRHGSTLADRVARHVLGHLAPGYVSYSFLKRGSDERQYCAPGVDLPVVSVMRTKYGDYPEYHTSDDNLEFISPEGLFGGFTALRRCLEVLELNETLVNTVLCEPQLGRRSLISNIGYGPGIVNIDRQILSHLLAYCDGSKDLVELCEIIDLPLWDISKAIDILKKEGLLEATTVNRSNVN